MKFLILLCIVAAVAANGKNEIEDKHSHFVTALGDQWTVYALVGILSGLVQSLNKELDDIVPDSSLKTFYKQVATRWNLVKEEADATSLYAIVQNLGALDARFALFVDEIIDESTRSTLDHFTADNDLAKKIKKSEDKNHEKVTKVKELITIALSSYRPLVKTCYGEARKLVLAATDSVIIMEAYAFFLESTETEYANTEVPKQYMSAALPFISHVVTTDLTDLAAAEKPAHAAFHNCYTKEKLEGFNSKFKAIAAHIN